jgi:hypothetical protein
MTVWYYTIVIARCAKVLAGRSASSFLYRVRVNRGWGTWPRSLCAGGSQAFAESLVEMHAAKDNGLDKSEPRTSENTTPTSFRQWCEEVLKPAYLS